MKNPYELEILKAIIAALSLVIGTGVAFHVYQQKKIFEGQRKIYSKIVALGRVFPQYLKDFNFSLIEHRYFATLYNRIKREEEAGFSQRKSIEGIVDSYNYYDKEKDRAREILIQRHQELLENIAMVYTYFAVDSNLEKAIKEFLDFDGYSLSFKNSQNTGSYSAEENRKQAHKEVRDKVEAIRENLSKLAEHLYPLIKHRPFS